MATIVGFPEDGPFERWGRIHQEVAEQMRRAMSPVLSSPLLQEMERIQNAFEPIRRAQEELGSVLASSRLREEMEQWQRIEEHWATDALRVRNQYAGELEAVAQAIQEAGSLAETIAAASAVWAGQDQIVQGLLRQIGEGVARSLENVDGFESEGLSLERVVDESVRHYQDLGEEDRDRVSIIQLVNVILVVFFGVSGLWLSYQTGEELRELKSEVSRGAQSQEEMSALLEGMASLALASADFGGEFFPTHTLSRTLRLHVGPKATSGSLGSYQAGTKVQVRLTLHRWALVLLPRRDEGELLAGWMYLPGLKSEASGGAFSN